MKHSVKDRVIILRKKPLGEADVLLTVYGEKSGKVRVVAKGARRITSKLLGYTELFTVISCQINFSSSIPVISQISHEQLFDGVAEQQTLYERLHIISELIERGTQEQESNPALFYVLVDGLQQIITTDHPMVWLGLVWRVTTMLGFSPQVLVCAHCGESIGVDDTLVWSASHGGVVRCEEASKLGTPMTTEEVKALRYLATAQTGSLRNVRLDLDVARRLESFLMGHVQYALEQDFTSSKVVGATV